MMKMVIFLTHEFTFMLGVSGLIFITRVWTNDIIYLVWMNYVKSKATLEGIPVLVVL